MNHQANNLREELKSAGATDSEVKDLLPIATNLKQLKRSKKLPSVTSSYNQGKSKWKIFLPFGVASITGLALGMALIILAQNVMPGNVLYPVQKLSDNVSMSVDPSYRGIVMMRRAEEVKQLITKHASSNLVLATLDDYQSEALAYKSTSGNYAVFEYCKSNLQQAVVIASGPEKQAINDTLSSLSNI